MHPSDLNSNAVKYFLKVLVSWKSNLQICKFKIQTLFRPLSRDMPGSDKDKSLLLAKKSKREKQYSRDCYSLEQKREKRNELRRKREERREKRELEI